MSTKRDLELFIVDIFICIQKIKTYTENFTCGDDLLHSEINWDATLRNLEIIGEALNNLLQDEKFVSLSPMYFRKVVNFRNLVSHGYFGISQEEVWNVVTEKLNLLEEDMKQIIDKNFDLSTAIEQELPKQANSEIVQYLKNLKKENSAR
ncbi:MAG: hypothetical protein COB99_07060 [Sulfurimonas sp.]|nr:MAG: hypothetical protein COB99_07060 [Sulfurimonas sp.]